MATSTIYILEFLDLTFSWYFILAFIGIFFSGLASLIFSAVDR